MTETTRQSPPDAAAVDREHDMQMQLIDALQEAVSGKAGIDTVREVFDRLADYSRAHFLSEQLVMRLRAYPHYEEHVREHDHMVACLDEMARRLADGPEAEIAGALAALRNDLVGHIQRQDRRFSDFLAGATG
jgi:hemerythrin